MNRTYKVVWNESLGTWIAVSELAKGKTKTSTIYLKNDQSVTDLILGQIPRTFQQLALVVAMGIFAPAAWAVDTQCFNGTGTMTTHTLDGGTVTEGRECTGSSQASVIITGNSDGASNSSYSEGVVLQTRINGSSGPTRNLFSGMNANNTDALNIRIGDSRSITNSTFNVFADTLSLGNASTLASATSSQAIGAGATVAAGATNSTAIGTGANVAANQTDAIAIGSSATVDKAGAVAIGSNSNTAVAAVNSTGTTINGRNYTFAGGGSTAAGDQVSVGQAGQERQIKNVAAGEVSATSTDSVNGSQLFATNKAIADSQTHYVSVSDGGVPDTNYNNDGAVGLYAVAIGVGANAQGTFSSAIGLGASTGTASVALGARTGSKDTRNSVAIGNAGDGSVAGGNFGTGALSSGVDLVAIGTEAGMRVKGSDNVAIGGEAGNDVRGERNLGLGTAAGSRANGAENIALGYRAGNDVQANRTLSIGTSAKASADDAVAVGAGAQATVNGSLALGANSQAVRDVSKETAYVPVGGTIAGASATGGEVSVGAVGSERRITNVAAASQDTDAVNLSQLKAAQAAATSHYVSINDNGTQGANYNNDGATGVNALAVGIGASATADNAIAIGNASSGAKNSIAIGTNNVLSNTAVASTAIGTNNNVTGNEALALGTNNTVKDFSGVAVGSYNNAEGYRSIAVGAENKTKGQWSSAFGVWNEAEGERSSVLGANNKIQGRRALGLGVANDISTASEYSSAIGAFNKITDSTQSLAAGYNNTITNAKNSTVLGNANKVEQENTQVLGNKVTTTQANSVVLGNESTDRAATAVDKVTINGEDYSVAGTGAVANGVVSVGKVGGERQIINVAAGEVSASSTDAINGSQLYATNQAITKSITDNKTHYVSINDDDTTGDNYNNDGAVGKNAVAVGVNAAAYGDRATAIGNGSIATTDGIALGSGNQANGLHSIAIGFENITGSGNPDNIVLGISNQVHANNTTVVGRNNTLIANDNNNVFGSDNEIQSPDSKLGNNTVLGNKNKIFSLGEVSNTALLGNNITATQANSVVLGNASADRAATVVDKISINGQDYLVAGAGSAANGVVSVGKVGGERQIINVAAGEVSASSTDAVNGSQLYATNQAITEVGKSAATAKTEVAQGDNMVVTESKGANGQSIYNVATAKEVSFDKTTVGTVITDSATGKITGLEAGTVSANSKDAINGSQLYSVSDSVSKAIGGSTTVNADGTITTSNIGGTGKNTVDEAITEVGKSAATAKTEVAQGDNIVVTESKGANGQSIYNVATAKEVSFDKTTVGTVVTDSATGKITGLNAGEVSATSTDAVNGSQLFATNKAIEDSKTHYVSVNDGGKQGANYNNDGATGKNAVAMGVGASAAGENAIAIGNNNKVAQNNTSVFGSNITTTQANSVVLGHESTDRAATSASKVTILGQDYAFAGVGSAANGVVSVGKVGGERQIINVAAGQLSATSTDAVNGSQLYATNQAISSLQDQVAGSKSTISEGKNTTVTKTTNADGSTDYQVATKDDVSFDSVTVGGIKADGQTNKITGLADGSVSATSNEAVNGSQLHGTAESIATSLGGNAKVNADGTISTSNIGNTGKDNVHDAIASIQGQVAGSKTSVSAGKNTVVSSSTNADGSNNYQVALADDIKLNSVTSNQVTANQVTANQVMANQVNVGKVTIDGTTNKVSGLANGTISKDSTDAVNGSQLHQTNSHVSQYLGGGSALNPDGTIAAPTYNVAGGTYHNVGDALGAVDARVTNLEQAFYNTNKNMEDLRNDTYAGIAGAMAVGNLPQPTEAGMSMMSAGLSGYRGETAVAVGISAITESNKIVWKMGASADSRSNIGGAVSVGYQWK
ncbi:ESPR-type extended signal peptide-containing protein [Acinetobacter nematophilus]|uniref:ESPR-type extended signal peptide-containing protein n=1 Tax=Acinetobacter nematophilus TaxID=2994642 RepID=A0A9X3IGD2_9GAMM|nr:YadA-like family protein [Acinetobacter nematophilus]MCX5466675.1 ESPR-type extended signal peptide-containing protein [Acinetobacter nematophilus]